MTALADQVAIGRPFKFQDIDALNEGIEAYFAQCEASKRPCTMSGLAYALGTNRNTLLAYEGEKDGRNSPGPLFVHAIKRARARVEQSMEERLLGKECHPVGAIFNLKNNFGWKDTQEIEHTHTLIAIGQPGGMLPAQLEPPCIDVTPIAQIVNENGVLPQAGDTNIAPAFAPSASLSPVPRNSKPVDK